MFETIKEYFNSSSFMPHGHCFLWKPGILWLHVVSDAVIALAYYSIPIGLFYFIRKRKDLSYKWMFFLFSLFILLCGTGHLADIYTMWNPIYQVEGIIKAATATVSILTAILLWPVIPKALSLPSPSLLAEKNRALVALNQELEERVELRTKDIQRANTDLKNKQTELTKVNKAKDDFLAGLSHELRSPLNIILGYTELIKHMTPGTTDYVNALNAIQSSGQMQLKMIEALLDVSRMVSGKLTLDVNTNNIYQLCDGALDAVRFSAKSKNITLEKNINVTPEEFVCDGDRLRQALWNLLSNAVKFTEPNGKIILEVQRSQGEMIFNVRDTGQGIEQKDIPHVFDRLWQKESDDSQRASKGLGLGLFIVRQIVEAHGGKIKVTSEGPGRGSCFTISLPIRAVQEGDELKRFEQAVGEDIKPLKGLNILLVDDSQEALLMVKYVLVKVGANVITAVNGKEALEIVRANNIKVIISDINMPEMDGFTFMQEVRKIEKAKGAVNRPAIALTAYTGKREQERVYQSGYQMHLSKPVSHEHLINIVSRLQKSVG